MNANRERLIFLVLAGGFFTMAFEVRQLHRDILDEYWQAQIPIYFSFAATAASFICLFSLRNLRMLGAGIFAIGTLVGLFGIYNHSEGDVGKALAPFTGVIVAQAKDGDEEGAGRRVGGSESESEPPPLAPMGIAGLSAIGLILAWPGQTKRSS